MIGVAYHDDMIQVRRKLLDRYWPQVKPAVQRILKEQKAPLTANQYEAVLLWLQQDFHIGQVDRVYLDLLIKNTEASVLYGKAPHTPETRYITVADCEDMTASQFSRVLDHLFAHFGYQVTRADDRWLMLKSAQRPPVLVFLEVRNVIVHQTVIDQVLVRQRRENFKKAIIVTVGRFGDELALPPGSEVELWDGDRVGALLDRIQLDPVNILG